MEKRNLLKCTWILFFSVFVLNASGQKRTINGKVTDQATGKPLADATVIVKGTNQSISLTKEGAFSVTVDSSTVLAISYVGYVSREITVGDRGSLDISLNANVASLNDVVVVGYGTQRKKALTGSVASLNYDQFKDRSFSNVAQSLAGQVAGVNVTQAQGAPGALPIIRIRGISSITAGTNPLFVVDGVPLEDFNLNMINPQDIQSVEILKDASSSAIYGSRGANGVIMVTTKLGKPGKANTNIGLEYGLQQVTRTVKMMDAQAWIRYWVTSKNNSWVDLNPAVNKASDPNSLRGSSTLYKIPEEFINDPGQFGEGTDWQDVMYSTAPLLNAQASISGGTDKTQYLFSANLLNQEAVLDNNYYKRITIRSNIRQQISSKVSAGLNLSFSGIQDRTEGTEGKSDVIGLALQSDPVFPIYNENGNLGIVDPNSVWNKYLQYNPVNLWHPYATTRFTDKMNKAYNTLILGFLEYEMIRGLKLKSSLSSNITNNSFNYYKYRNQGYGYNQDLASSTATESSGNKLNWLWENTATYNYSTGDHDFNVLAGYSAQKERTEFQSITAGNFPNDLVQTLNAGTVTGGTSTASEWAISSFLARLNYNFKNRFFLTASIRSDGSSRFSKDKQWGYFPSVSAGWVVSDENFLKDADWLSLLKLKVSYGTVGNNQIPNYGSIGLLGGVNYVYNGTITPGLRPISISNPDLRWEKTNQFNAGIDVSMFHNRISVSVEAYHSITNDMLLNVPIPDITGFSSQLTNIGKMRNKGIELMISSKNIQKKFTWTTDFNFSLNRNEVLQLGPGNAPIYYTDFEATVKTAVGNPLSDFYGYIFDGVYNNQADIGKSPHAPNAKPGDPIVRDVNKDGQITTADKTVIGNNQPDFIAGLTNRIGYKGLELSFLITGSFGGEIVNQNYRFLGYWNSGRNFFANISNFWESEQNPGDGKNPRPSMTRSEFRTGFSTLWVEDASFIRIRNINLSYSLPASIIRKTPLSSIRFYVNADNVKLFSNYTGYDPENTTYQTTSYNASTTAANTGTTVSSLPSGAMIGLDYGSYPLPLVVTVGLKLGF